MLKLTAMTRNFCLLTCFFLVGMSHAETLKVAYVARTGDHLPLWVAAEAGLFKKEELDVQMVYIPGGSVLTQAMLSGDIALANMAPPSALTAWARGADLSLLAVGVGVPLLVVMTPPHIKTPDDLKGKKVGVSRYGSLTDLALREALKQFNVRPDKDVAILQAGDAAERLVALKSGAIDGAILTPDQSYQAEKMGFHVVIDVSKLPVDYPINGIVARRLFIRNSRDTAKRFLKAWSQGIRVAKTDKDLSVKTLAKYLGIKDKDILSKSYETHKAVFQSIPYTQRKGIAFMLERLTDASPELGKLNPDGFIDGSLLSELVSEGLFK